MEPTKNSYYSGPPISQSPKACEHMVVYGNTHSSRQRIEYLSLKKKDLGMKCLTKLKLLWVPVCPVTGANIAPY